MLFRINDVGVSFLILVDTGENVPSNVSGKESAIKCIELKDIQAD